MKHGFVSEMQNILENDTKMTHEALATKVVWIFIDNYSFLLIIVL